MAAARLRKAFHYPEDSDDDKHEREELDEEEQESVIERLRAQNDKRDAEYSVYHLSPKVVANLKRLSIANKKLQLDIIRHLDSFRYHPTLIGFDVHPISVLTEFRYAGASPFVLKHSFINSNGIHYEILPSPESGS
ncbi:hypothetical protein ETB97_007057 [Aspergillus alliaceus]|uniref:Uncharacterized protein n=1 Tax=Petromyces alliaceus TaxID=209559 RepID=A0A8H6E375_PETAA|nr:hypothetical protein ETB97_007057 [Aspergillus burnettii]